MLCECNEAIASLPSSHNEEWQAGGTDEKFLRRGNQKHEIAANCLRAHFSSNLLKYIEKEEFMRFVVPSNKVFFYTHHQNTQIHMALHKKAQ